MARFLFSVFLIMSGFLSQLVHAQEGVDSLRSLMKQAPEKKKGELNLEIARSFLTDLPDSTIFYARAAQRIAKRTHDRVTMIRSFTMIGEAYQKQNKLKEAISAYLKGLELAEKHNEKSLAGTIYNGIGVCYFYLNNLDKAEEYTKRAAQAKKEANDYQYYSIIAINLASMQIMKQSFDESLNTLKDAEKTLLKSKQTQYLAALYNAMGAAYQSVTPDSCVYYYEKSLEYSRLHQDHLIQMNTYQNLGDYYFSKKEHSKAIAYMKQAIATNDLRPEDQYKPALFDRISALYDSIGDFKNAYHYKKLETQTRQRLTETLKEKEIEELEIKYETEKKEKEIQLNKQEIARKDNQQNIILFGAVSLFLVAGFVTYLVFQRRKITREFEQEKLRLFENIFHEIRTPLTLIDGPIQLLKTHSDASVQEQLSLMERNSKKLIHLVNELLDASKLGKGSFQLHYTNGNVNDFVEQVISGFASEAAAKKITLIQERAESEQHRSFPSNAVEKVLSNLVGNALKYSPSGAEVRISTQISGTELRIKVSDNGPGIPKKDQKKVFRRFFRGKHGTAITGTGIGLSLVKELVELAGGTITLQSSSFGTSFDVSFPIQNQEKLVADQLPRTASDEKHQWNEEIPVLLLAEDDTDMAAFSISVLWEDFRVIHVENGQKAMDAIRENLPDLVLSDVMMPEKDGFELLREIRSNELTNHLPVVLFSAKASAESRLEGLQHGADAYVAKPFSPEELKLTVRNLFNTIQRNKTLYQESVHSEKTFAERIQSSNAYVNKVIECIVHHISDADYSVNELADELAVSRSQLHRKLTALTGFSTTAFISMIRLEKAKDLLQDHAGNITEIAYQCGFNSQSYFTKSFTEYFGKSPSQFVKKP